MPRAKASIEKPGPVIYCAAMMMRRKNSKKPLVLQPPAGFRTAHAEGVLTLSDGSLLKPDSRGLYYLDSAHLRLLPSFIAQGWHAPSPELPTPAAEHAGNAQPLTTPKRVSRHIHLRSRMIQPQR